MKIFAIAVVIFFLVGCETFNDTISTEKETQQFCSQNDVSFDCAAIQAMATQARVVEAITQSVEMNRISAKQGQHALDEAIDMREKIEQLRALGESTQGKIDLNDATSVLLTIEQFLLTYEKETQ